MKPLHEKTVPEGDCVCIVCCTTLPLMNIIHSILHNISLYTESVETEPDKLHMQFPSL